MNIITIDYFLRADNVTNIEISGDETLLDADLVIVNPIEFSKLWLDNLQEGVDGKLRLYTPFSERVKRIFESRKKEIETLLENGKIIIVFISPRAETQAVINNAYEYMSNYGFLPLSVFYMLGNLKAGKGTGDNQIKLTNTNNLFSQYYKAFKDELSYSAYLDISTDQKNYFMTNRSNKPVGFTFEAEKGLIAFLPAPTYSVDNKKLIGVLIESTKHFLTKQETSPPPNWENDYILQGEIEVNKNIEALQDELLKLNKDISTIEGQKKQIIPKFCNQP